MTLFSLIYKGALSKTSPNKIIRAQDFSDLVSAKDILEMANEEREKLFEHTAKECQEIKKQAYEDGKQEGLVTFNEQLIYLDQKVKEMQHEMQKLVLPLALKAAKKIVGSQLELHPETIVEIVMQALKPVRQNHEIKIIVSKEDKQVLEDNKETLKNLFDQLRIFSIEERESLSKGSCIIETEAGIINASLENQWKALEAAFENFSKRS
jgi:type III secretion protein L